MYIACKHFYISFYWIWNDIWLNTTAIQFVTRLKYSSQQTNCYTPASLPALALIHSPGACCISQCGDEFVHHWPIRGQGSVVASVSTLMLRLSAGTNCARTDVHFYKLPPWCCNPISANVLSNVQFQTIFWIPNDYIRHSNSSKLGSHHKSHINRYLVSTTVLFPIISTRRPIVFTRVGLLRPGLPPG